MLKITDVRSKLVDGLLAGGVLILLELVLILLIRPIQLIFSRPGMLVFTVSILAMSGFCLEQSLSDRYSDWTRAWWGVIGGVFAWVTIELSVWLGNQILTGETGILMLMLVLLLVSVLWRRIALLGMRYFFILVLMGWIGHVVLKGIAFLAKFEPFFGIVLNICGYVSIVVLIGALLYNFFRTQNRLERLNSAIIIWFMVTIMIDVFRGGII
jgi:hypothetical protein